MEGASLPEAPLDVAVAVIEDNGRYLITQRLPDDSFGGAWEFPGGKLDPGETLEACVIREMKEELDITVVVGRKMKEIEHRYPTRTIRLHCFSCRIVQGEPRPIECATWRWILAEEFDQFPFPPASMPLIEQIQASSIKRQASSLEREIS